MSLELHRQGDVGRQYERALALPIGMASPLWFVFGAAASAATAWYWMSRWTPGAALVGGRGAPPLVERVQIEPEAAETVPEVQAALVSQERAEPPVDEPTGAAPGDPRQEPSTTLDAPAAALEPDARPDELTRLVGVGPRVADALVARGITRFSQLAAWTPEMLAEFDASQRLMGRSQRYDFIGQARALAEEG